MAADAERFTLTLSRRTKRRKAVNLLMQVIATVAALSAVAVLALVIASVAERGAGALSWDFFTKSAATFGESGGGVANALVGRTTPKTVRQRLAPSARAPSRRLAGTSASTSCVERATSGSMMIARAKEPFHAACPLPTTSSP